MRRFEFSEGRSDKFWEIAVDSASMTTRWGRIGTKGKEKTQLFSSPQAAQKEQDKLVASKLREGYHEIDAEPLQPLDPAWSAAGCVRWAPESRAPKADGKIMGDANRFEDGESFWEYEKVRGNLVTRFGTIGSPGETVTREFDAAFAADVARDRDIKAILNEGYHPVGQPLQIIEIVPPVETVTLAPGEWIPVLAPPGEICGLPPKKPRPILSSGADPVAKTGSLQIESALIRRLDSWLRGNRNAFYEELNVGITPAALAEWELRAASSQAAVNLSPDWFQNLPQSFRDLYLWKDGQSTEEVGFVNRFCLNPLASCYVGQPIPGAITFLDSLSWREMISIDMLGLIPGPEGNKPGQIIGTSADDVIGWVICPSLEKWLEVLVVALQEGCACGVDESDDSRPPASFEITYLEVLQRICPGYPGEDKNLRHLWV